jgi:hypothetical protein
MTRGRPPQKALDEALPVARARGDLLEFREASPPFECDFMFLAPDRPGVVWVKRTRHLWCMPEDLAAQCGEAIIYYRHLPVPAYASREIWFWSPYSVFRYFRIEDAGLVELDRDGKILSKAHTRQSAAKDPAKAGAQG